MSLVIAVSGLHGTGKSTYAREVAKRLGLRHVSAGDLFRQIAAERNASLSELSREAEENDELDRLLDERTQSEAAKGSVVVDGLLAGWMVKDSNALKICVSAPYPVRVSRIASRDGISYGEADTATAVREGIERRRFKRLYGIDIDDLSIYDLVLNTGLLSVEASIEVIISFVDGYVKSHVVR